MERAILKIEIPFTDHAHCIGRQGNQIQSIMSATDTHIHFPDGNREPNGTKSNQVSITGTISAIEEARKRVKDILPMSLKFLIPSKHLFQLLNDDCPLFENVRARFGVLVLPRSYAKTGDVYCIVRGLINQSGLAEATEYLLQIFYGFESSSIKVTCQIEVSEQYHIYLQTRQQAKDMSVTSIEEYTHTTIQFPTTVTNGFERRTSVIIMGSPSEVCQARKLFDLCLPIILTFEIPIEKEPTRAEIIYMKDKLNVTTIIRTRKDKFGKLISIQTQEYNIEQLFHARLIILDLIEIQKNIFPMPWMTRTSFDLNSISTEEIDTSLIPVKEMTVTKKPSPIGHERSFSLKNFDQDASNWPTNIEQFSSLLIPDSSKHPSSSTELFTLLHSMKSYSTFDYDQIIPWPNSFDNDRFYNNFFSSLNKNFSHVSSSSLLSI